MPVGFRCYYSLVTPLFALSPQGTFLNLKVRATKAVKVRDAELRTFETSQCPVKVNVKVIMCDSKRIQRFIHRHLAIENGCRQRVLLPDKSVDFANLPGMMRHRGNRCLETATEIPAGVCR